MSEKVTGTLKKALPLVAIGLGLLLAFLVYREWSATSPSPSGQVMATGGTGEGYGTATSVSGIPWYDQYQSNLAPTQVVRDFNATPNPYGYTYDGAIRPSPICERCKDGSCTCTVNDMCPTSGNGGGCAGGGRAGCLDRNAANYDPTATCNSPSGCIPKKYGCLRRDNVAFNPWANTHDERFCSNVYVESGCTTPGSINRSPSATVNDGSCVPIKVGCMDPQAINLDTSANVPCEGCCIPKVRGCTDLNAPNYQIGANIDDGSCLAQTAAAAAATFNHPQLGAVRNCGDPWDLTAHSIGATQY